MKAKRVQNFCFNIFEDAKEHQIVETQTCGESVKICDFILSQLHSYSVEWAWRRTHDETTTLWKWNASDQMNRTKIGNATSISNVMHAHKHNIKLPQIMVINKIYERWKLYCNLSI